MDGRLASLYRHPVKGFTPERLSAADLVAGGYFPCDRLYAVERGPSGFDPQAPEHLSKWRFTVLANHPTLARVVTAYDEASTTLSVQGEGLPSLTARLDQPAGRAAFEVWLATLLKDEEGEPLRLLDAGPRHRFSDDAVGFVSLVNLESLREFGRRVGRTVDPLRLRANLYVEGWAPWSELDLQPGAQLALGGVALEVIKPIPRCIATHVDPASGERDLDMLPLMRREYGHVDCGLYLRVIQGGRLCEGDATFLFPAHPEMRAVV
jgi:uncharacterized protein